MPPTQKEILEKFHAAQTAIKHYQSLPEDDSTRNDYYDIVQKAVAEYNQVLQEAKAGKAQEAQDTPNVPTAGPVDADEQSPAHSAPSNDLPPETMPSPDDKTALNPPPTSSENPSPGPEDPHPSQSPPHEPDESHSSPPHESKEPASSPPHEPTSTAPHDSRSPTAPAIDMLEQPTRTSSKGAEEVVRVDSGIADGLGRIQQCLDDIEVRVKSIFDALEDSTQAENVEELVVQVGDLVKNVDHLQPLLQVTEEIHQDAEALKKVLLGGQMKGEANEESQLAEGATALVVPVQVRLQNLEERLQSLEKHFTTTLPSSFAQLQASLSEMISQVLANALFDSHNTIMATLSSIESSIKDGSGNVGSFPSPEGFVGNALAHGALVAKAVLESDLPSPVSEHERRARSQQLELTFALHAVVDRAANAHKVWAARQLAVPTGGTSELAISGGAQPVESTPASTTTLAPTSFPKIPIVLPVTTNPTPPTPTAIPNSHPDDGHPAIAATSERSNPPHSPPPKIAPGSALSSPSTSKVPIVENEPLSLPSPPAGRVKELEATMEMEEETDVPATNTRNKRKHSQSKSQEGGNVKKAKAPNSKRGKM